MQELTWTWRWVLKAPADKLWPLVANTDLFNRYVGLPPLDYRPIVLDNELPRREATMRRHGIRLVWEEFPFEFEEPRWFSVYRRYRTGPVAEMRVRVDLQPHHEGTEILYAVRARPRYALAAPAIRFAIGVASHRRFGRAFHGIEQALARGVPSYPEPPALAADLRAPITNALEGLDGGTALADYLLAAPDTDLSTIRPFRLASRLHLSRDAALLLCLQATRAGVLDAIWKVLCPHCRGPKLESADLKGLSFQASCDACRVDFSADFDRLTELVFRLSPRWKALQSGEYCIGGPGNTPHVAVQFSLSAASETSRTLALGNGAYQIRSVANPLSVTLVIREDGAETGSVSITADDKGHQELHLKSPGTLRFENATSKDALVAIERTAWADDACSAAYVSSLQAHRDLFGKDVLAPGVAVRIATMTILFTDLKESTAMYGRVGDAPAFGVVRSHFEVMYDAARRHHGAVVKTIGDAVMECFLEPAHAIEAALQMHREISRLRAADGQPLVLKIGLHAGPCFAVTMNDTLDYFGTTVNLAARIQGHATGEDILLDRDLAMRPEVQTVIRGLPTELLEVDLKGFTPPSRRLVRILPTAGTP